MYSCEAEDSVVQCQNL